MKTAYGLKPAIFMSSGRAATSSSCKIRMHFVMWSAPMRRVRFHSLRGEAKRWSLRVTGGLRIKFGWSDEEAQDIDFENYQ
jgi:hypothetical protein